MLLGDCGGFYSWLGQNMARARLWQLNGRIVLLPVSSGPAEKQIPVVWRIGLGVLLHYFTDIVFGDVCRVFTKQKKQHCWSADLIRILFARHLDYTRA